MIFCVDAGAMPIPSLRAKTILPVVASTTYSEVMAAFNCGSRSKVRKAAESFAVTDNCDNAEREKQRRYKTGINLFIGCNIAIKLRVHKITGMEEVNASVITIGDELLIGQTIDTNSAFIATALNSIGIWLKRRVAIGDVKKDILETLDQEKKHSRIIIITGGLGPTADDI